MTDDRSETNEGTSRINKGTMRATVGLGHIAGIPVGFNWSMLVVFWLLTWSLATVAFPESSPGLSAVAYWAVATGSTVVFYGSLLAHELAHSLVAGRNGIRVRQITLWLFGGVAQLDGEALSPGADFRIAIAGPATSGAAAIGFGAAAVVIDVLNGPGLAVAAAGWLAGINVTLAVFNLIPAAPLDGGRVLRAALWRRHGDRGRAAVTAARAGRVFGYVLIGLGLLEFTAVGAAGLWLVFLGWFLLSAARSEETHYVLREALAGVLVRDVMTRDPITAQGSINIERLFDELLWRAHISSVPLVDSSGATTGLITLDRVRHVPRSEWMSTAAAGIAAPMRDVTTAAPGEPLIDLLGRMADSPNGRALIMEEGRLVGIVSPSDIARAIQMATLNRGGVGLSRTGR